MQAVLFDLDGTLIDSSEAIVAALDASLAERGHPPVAPEAGRALIGLPLLVMFPRLIETPLDEAELHALIEAYRRHYVPLAHRLERTFDGVPALLRALVRAGRRLAIVTSKATAGAEAALARAGLREHFEVVLGYDAVTRPKPAPDLAQAALAALGLPAERAILVGDTDYDLEMGARAGITSVGVGWGAHPRERLEAARPIAIVDDLPALARVLGLSTEDLAPSEGGMSPTR